MTKFGHYRRQRLVMLEGEAVSFEVFVFLESKRKLLGENFDCKK